MSENYNFTHEECSLKVQSGELQWGNDKEVREYVESLARRIRKTCSSELELTDLIALGYIGILQSQESFDGTKGYGWKQHAYWRTYGAMVDGARQWSHQSHCRTLVKRDVRRGKTNGVQFSSVSSSSFTPDEDGIAHLQTMSELPCGMSCHQERDVIQRDLVRKIGWLATSLPMDQRVIIELYYHFEMSMKEIGVLLGHTKSWVSRKHKTAVSTLQHAFSVSENE